QIQTETGNLSIHDSRLLGQRVLSYNEQTQTWEYKTVTRWLDRGERSILSIHTDRGDLRCTHSHLIQTVRGWIKAQDLQAGDQIFSPMDTNLATVRSVRPAGRERVYDLEVEDNHNFVANGLSVHNCHMLSTAAFNALLKTLEEPPDRVVFVLATTDPQRVLPTIISRCQRFDFRRIPLDAMVRHLSTIAAKETIDIVNPAITLVAQLAQGGLRDAESLLDQLSLLPPPVTPEAVWDLVGAVPERDLLALVKAIVADDPEAALDRTRELMNRGREPLIVLQNLASFYRDLLIAKTAPQRGDMVAVTEETWQEMCVLAKTFPLPTLLQGQQNLRSSETQLKNTTQPRLWLEVTLMGLLPSALVPIAPHPPLGV
ncbi:MAG: polymorphic toxin-type HINT domain-containing protein, partial [Prochlorotrichaceae cyanobacterium]